LPIFTNRSIHYALHPLRIFLEIHYHIPITIKILHTVFVTGDSRTGKTVLANETASYGFSDVTYLKNSIEVKVT